MTQDRKPTLADIQRQRQQAADDLQRIELARKDGILTDKQYEAMRAAILSRPQDTP